MPTSALFSILRIRREFTENDGLRCRGDVGIAPYNAEKQLFDILKQMPLKCHRDCRYPPEEAESKTPSARGP